MQNNWPILSLVTFLPLVGAAFILTIRGEAEIVDRNSRYVALWTTLITFVLSLSLWFGFERGTAEFQFVERHDWLPQFNMTYHMGVDGISMPFVMLCTLLTPLCILASWEAIQSRVKEYMITFLLLETLMIGTFCALDFIVFFIFFEGVLIPMFLIIGIWGGPRRIYSTFKFFLFTLVGSVLGLLAILKVYAITGTTDIQEVLTYNFAFEDQRWLWLAFFASFAIKLPMWPVHTWLPDAHVEAPTAGSVVLAGILLKMGAYGFLRFLLSMFPEASIFYSPLVFTLSLIAIIYGSLVAFAQHDMKKLVAYSSVAHMGYYTVGVFTGIDQGTEGALFHMLSHGIISPALFLVVGVVYDRIHTREIDAYGGLADRMPAYALVFMIFMMGSVGLPGTNGFVGEFLVIVGAFQANTLVALLTASSMVLGPVYMLYVYRRVIFGKLTKRNLMAILDLSLREKVIFAPLVVLTFWMGIYPASFLDIMSGSISHLLADYYRLAAAADTPTVTAFLLGK